MKVIQYPIIPISLAFGLGIGLKWFFPISIGIQFIFIVLCIILLLIINFKKETNLGWQKIFTGSLLILFLFLGTFIYSTSQEIASKNHFSKFIQIENEITGVVKEQLKPSNFYYKYILSVENINRKETLGKLLIYLPKNSKKLPKVGEYIQLKNKINWIKSIENPYSFNYTAYLNNQQIFFESKLKPNQTIQIKEQRHFSFYLFRIKRYLIAQFDRYKLTQEDKNLLAALLFGEKTILSKEIMQNYTNSGVVHILAISGLHIALIFQMLVFLLKPLKTRKNGKKYVLILSILLLWSYAFITGFSASVMRSVLFFTLLNAAILLNRQVQNFNVLALTALILLIWNPNYLFDIGLQLSFLAVVSLLIASNWIRKWSYHSNKIILKTKELILISIVAQLGVLPIVLFHFGQFPLHFIISNLIAIPLSNIILCYGFILVFFSFLPESLLKIMSWIMHELITLMNKGISNLNAFDSLIIKNIAFNSLMMVFLTLIVFALLSYFYHPKKKKIIIILFVVLALQFSYIYSYYYNSKSSEWTVLNAFNSTLIANKNNKEVIFFTNDSIKNQTLIANYTRKRFIEKYKIKPLNYCHSYNKYKILVLDNKIRKVPAIDINVLLLTESPKINLERIIHKLKPEIVIVNQSNFKSYVLRWQSTCEKLKIPFHITAEKGNYVLE